MKCPEVTVGLAVTSYPYAVCGSKNKRFTKMGPERALVGLEVTDQVREKLQ